MPTDDQTVRVVFEAVDRYTGVANRIQQNMQSVSGSAQQLVVSSQAIGEVTGWEDLERKLLAATNGMDATVGSATEAAVAHAAMGREAVAAGSQVEKAMTDRAAPSVDNLAKKAMGLAKTFGMVAGSIAAAGYTINKALDFAEAGSRLTNLERSFESFAFTAGTSGDAVLAATIDASNGMLSQAQAMQEYNRTYLLAGEEIANQMPRLIQVALAATASGMGDFDYMLNSLVTGLGRLSTPILDNLGLTLSLEKAYADYAETIGTTADELSKGQQQLAVWAQIQEQMTAKVGDLDQVVAQMAGQGVPRLRAAWEDFTDYLKVEAAPTIDMVAGAMADMLEAIPTGMPRTEAIIADMEALQAGGREAEAVLRRLKLAHDDTAGGMEILEGWLLQEVAAMNSSALSAEQYSQLLERIGGVSAKAAAELEELHNIQVIANRQAAFLASTTEGLAGAMDDATLAAQREAHALEILSGGLAAAQEAAWGRWRATQGAQYQKPAGIDPLTGEPWYYSEAPWKARDTIEDINRFWAAHDTGISKAKSGFNELQRAMESYYESWASQAEAILTPTQTVDMEALMEEVYGYQEKWDEVARRAMDVVKLGAESPWAQPMGLESKEEALQYIRDFYAGKLPEAVNWEAAIGQYQTQMEGIAGQKTLSQMFQEQLIGAGWGPENETVMAALEAPFEPSGTSAATSFANAFAEYDWNATGMSVSDLILSGVTYQLNHGKAPYTDWFASFIVKTVKDFFFAGAEP